MTIRTDYMSGEERTAAQVNEENTEIINAKDFIDNYNPTVALLQTTRVTTDANSTVTVAHGLGVVPKYVIVEAMCEGNGGEILHSHGFSNGSANNCVSRREVGSSFEDYTAANYSDRCIEIYWTASGAAKGCYATITFDATNVSIAWTRQSATNAGLTPVQVTILAVSTY